MLQFKEQITSFENENLLMRKKHKNYKMDVYRMFKSPEYVLL